MVQRNGGYIVAAIVATIGWQFFYTQLRPDASGSGQGHSAAWME